MKTICKFLGIFVFCITLAACGSSSTTSTDSHGGETGTETGGETGGETGSDTVDTTAGKAFPVDLVVTSPYTESASASINVGKASKALDNFASERTELQDIIAGENPEDCTFSLSLFDTAMQNPECYGPTVDYTNHPDSDGGSGGGSMPIGDLGIWGSTQGTEPCAAAKLNQLMDSVGSKVDSAVKLFASMACTLNIDALDLPEVGRTIDLKSGFENILSANSISQISVTTATLVRSENDAEGHAVYDYAFTGVLTNNENPRNTEFYLRHIPLDDNNATYKGKLSYVIADGAENPTGVAAGSVLYSKSSATSLVTRMQDATYQASEGVPSPLSEDTKEIDPTNTYDEDPINGWNNGFYYVLFSIDPQTGAGSYAYAWSAGSLDSHSRAFNATLSVADDGTKTGCAYYGFGPKISLNTDLGTIDGMICNWTGPNNIHEPVALVQRECMVSSDNSFIIDPSIDLNITYAPTNSCNSSGGGFSYSTGGEGGGNMTNDNSTGAAVTNDLLPIVDMVFTMPEVPSDVY
ncbi:MAG: hypothetical protein COS89_06070 [Deltaproteobacteria bacterium CG07_land_8_20_14_0_80_38_7]|nr:MAG: hypothetical protein COS89_06070 [Deltaproteobacteria bacterium CG07_land_8_20_14_0_80_38_7]